MFIVGLKRSRPTVSIRRPVSKAEFVAGQDMAPMSLDSFTEKGIPRSRRTHLSMLDVRKFVVLRMRGQSEQGLHLASRAHDLIKVNAFHRRVFLDIVLEVRL